MTVCYVEADDEITGAISQLRAVRDGEAIVVVPAGSRIATSRINFKLLAREGGERGLSIVAVSDEPSVRALAISAGLPAYDSIPAAERALSGFRAHDARLAERLAPRRPGRTAAKKSTESSDRSQLSLTLGLPAASDAAQADAPPTQKLGAPASERSGRGRATDWVIPRTTTSGTVGATTRGLARRGREVPPGEAAPPRTDQAAREERVLRRSRRLPAAPIIGAVVLLLLLTGVGYGAYVLLPTATITLHPATTELRPQPFTVVADPNVAVADPAIAVIPAEFVQIPITVSGQFAATGVTMREIRATGTVRFRSENTVNEVGVVEGTRVSTEEGTEFETTQAAIVPRADFATSTPGQVDVPIRAVRGGPVGNVDAGTITELPTALRAQLVSVRNTEPTGGGRRVEQSVVSQADYDAAVAALTGQLASTLAGRLSDPAAIPAGLTVYPATAETGVATPDPPAEAVVDTEAETFTVTVTTSAAVLAANETLIDEVAEARLRALLQPGQLIVGDEVVASHTPGSVNGDQVVFTASPRALVYAQPDQAALMSAVRGKSIAEARQILSAYGMADISIWPDFVDRLPDQTARINLVVASPSPRA